MPYAEHAPPADLRPFVRAFWWRTEDAEATAPVRVLPDGCADLLIDLRDDVARDRRLRWVGTMTRARLVESSPAVQGVLFGVRFEPGALAAFVRSPLHAVTDADVPFEALGARFGAPSPLLDGDGGTAHAGVMTTLAQMTAALRQVSPASSPLLRLSAALRATDTVDALLARTGWSARTLERRFQVALGVSPKAHLRYLRFEAALAAVRRGERFIDLALATGYADQAHFGREFSRFAGLSPRAYRAELTSR